MNYGPLIRKARKHRKWTLQNLSDELSELDIDIDAGNLSRLETGKQGASNEVLDGILRVFGISVEELLLDAAGSSEDSNIAEGPEIKGLCPVISWIQAGNWCEVTNVASFASAEEWLPCPVPHGPNTFILRIMGESMLDPHGPYSFTHGDMVFFDPDKPAINGSFVAVKILDTEEATFKQLIVEGDRQYLKALNPSWPNRIMEIGENAVICGVAICKHQSLP